MIARNYPHEKRGPGGDYVEEIRYAKPHPRRMERRKVVAIVCIIAGIVATALRYFG